jgi:predicted RNase H-like HicB family nuclease
VNQQYLVVIESAPHNFSAYSPDLPGCIATGKTREETLQNMREAIAFHLEGLREDGELIPPATSTAEYVAV